MGCVLAKEASLSPTLSSSGRRRREKKHPVADGSKSQAALPGIEIAWQEDAECPDGKRHSRRRRQGPDPRLSSSPGHVHGELVAAGWPSWLSNVAGEAIKGWTPRRTYSNVYRARDMLTGKVVAMKKVRFDTMEPESVKFMAREILILRRLDHPNVVKLEGLVTSRMSCSLYLVFEYMEHDLAGLAANPKIKFTEPQVKCYMHQLLSGLEHCHSNGVLHRDIKGSNLLIDNEGLLKIADFGLATFFDPNHKHQMTSRVVTLWYRAPELLLGAIDYGVGIDLWSAGCILAELLAGKPIMPGRTEVEQLHKIFKLCGSPSEDYWKKSKLPHATIFKPQQPYKRCIKETFKDFPPSSLPLVETLLAIDPAERSTSTAALNCEYSTICMLKAAGRKANSNVTKRTHTFNRAIRAVPPLEANAELQVNLDRRHLITHANAKSKSEKFPPPHQDGALGYPLESSYHMDPAFDPPETSFSTVFPHQKGGVTTWSGPLVDPVAVGDSGRKKQSAIKSWMPAKRKQPVGANATNETHKVCNKYMKEKEHEFSSNYWAKGQT
ncbi:hypothetical protein C4D60_Mb06t20390 [Musa balbisiana]|uniref:[RNA-polymerase]-subunit kinase n=1 Tax=Musa balbisiana TaxID=52838 RepID=A0A4S8IQP9_MUSBA|nr:hypothetical protein C4D60_Mb06t20390 [Musa balbisiana]